MAENSTACVGKSFIVKLHKILNNPEYFDIIAWSKDGVSIVIKNISEMMQKVLPTIYKHHNYSSFVRQLNTYGFNKLHNEDGEHVYHHEYFSKHQRPNYSMINRKHVQREKQLSISSQQPGIKELVVSLSERMEAFQQRIIRRETENQKMILEKLRYLQRINFQLQKKTQEQGRLIAQILGQTPVTTSTNDYQQKEAETKSMKMDCDFMIRQEYSSSGANTSIQRHWNNFSESESMAEILSIQDYRLDSLDLLCQAGSDNITLI